jgi:beta-glucuronidase
MNSAKKTAPDTMTLDDPLGNILDVLGVNEYLGWYAGKPEDADHLKWLTAQNKPLIFSEFGAGALAGRHGDAQERWTEEYQASVYEHQINMLRKIPSLAGMSPWVLMDFHSPRRLLPGVQDDYNRKGLVSNTGVKKQAFFVLQKFYGEMQQAKP